MNQNLNIKRLLAACLVIILIAAAISWSFGLLPVQRQRPPQNSILVIKPYRYNGTWVFDDDRFDLVREPFVAGIPEMIDVLVAKDT